MSEPSDGPFLNTDRELWRERPDDYYADSLHVTESGGIGINCGGLVFVKPIREWHALAKAQQQPTHGDAVNVGVRVAAGAGDPQESKDQQRGDPQEGDLCTAVRRYLSYIADVRSGRVKHLDRGVVLNYAAQLERHL